MGEELMDRSSLNNNMEHNSILILSGKRFPGEHRGRYFFFLLLFPDLFESQGILRSIRDADQSSFFEHSSLLVLIWVSMVKGNLCRFADFQNPFAPFTHPFVLAVKVEPAVATNPGFSTT